MEPIVVANEPTSFHRAMSSKGVQWDAEGGNMEDVPDSYDLSVKEEFEP